MDQPQRNTKKEIERFACYPFKKEARKKHEGINSRRVGSLHFPLANKAQRNIKEEIVAEVNLHEYKLGTKQAEVVKANSTLVRYSKERKIVAEFDSHE